VTPLLFDASPLLASAVFVSADGEVLTGADAARAAGAAPAGLEPSPKQRIDDSSVWLGERDVPVVELLGAVLSRVGSEARRVAGSDPAETVLTYPAGWSRARLAVLAEAARRAGLGEVGLIREPVAAAAYFASVLGRQLPVGQCLVVYDFGAGTFDVSVVRLSATGGEVIAADGLTDTGGNDLDSLVVDLLRTSTPAAAEAWGRLDWPTTPGDRRARRTLWLDARAAKEQLTRHSRADVHIPIADLDGYVTREEFEGAARPLLERTVALTVATLRAAGVRREAIGGILLVGGSSRIPLAASLLHRSLGIAPTVIEQPELVVAYGSLHTSAQIVATSLPHIPNPPAAPLGDPPPRTSAAQAVPPAASAVPAARPAPPVPPEVSPLIVTPAPVAALSSPSAPNPLPDSPVVPSSSSNGLAPFTSPTATPAPEPGRRRRSRVLAGAAVLVLAVAVTFVVWYAQGRPDWFRRGPVLLAHDSEVLGLTFSPDGQTLATVSNFGHVRVWNLATHRTVIDFKVVSNGSIGMSQDGKKVAIAGGGQTILRVWNVATGKAAATIDAAGVIRVVALSPDGNTVAAAVDGGGTWLGNANTGQQTATLPGSYDLLASLAFSPDGKALATFRDQPSDHRIRVWNVETRKVVTTTISPSGGELFGKILYGPDDNTIATSNYRSDKSQVWDVSTGKATTEITGRTTGILTFSPDGKTFVTSSNNHDVDDSQAQLRNTATGAVIATLTGHTDYVRCAAFSPDGKTVATGGDDNNVRLWNADTGQPI
jgi:WD40 repeat protein